MLWRCLFLIYSVPQQYKQLHVHMHLYTFIYKERNIKAFTHSPWHLMSWNVHEASSFSHVHHSGYKDSFHSSRSLFSVFTLRKIKKNRSSSRYRKTNKEKTQSINSSVLKMKGNLEVTDCYKVLQLKASTSTLANMKRCNSWITWKIV